MRETAFAHYRELLESMARLDIRLLCYNFMAGPGWSRTGVRPVRGGALATYFSKAEYDRAYVPVVPSARPLRLTKAQVWSNYECFVKAVMPTAMRVGVRIAGFSGRFPPYVGDFRQISPPRWAVASV